MPTDLEHAEFLADALRRNGIRSAKVWVRPGFAPRIYMPGDQYVSVGMDGRVDSINRGRQTFDERLLWPAMRQAWRRAYQAHREWHLARLAEQNRAFECALLEEDEDDG